LINPKERPLRLPNTTTMLGETNNSSIYTQGQGN